MMIFQFVMGNSKVHSHLPISPHEKFIGSIMFHLHEKNGLSKDEIPSGNLT